LVVDRFSQIPIGYEPMHRHHSGACRREDCSSKLFKRCNFREGLRVTAIILGCVTLMYWMAAGVTAVLGATDEDGQAEKSKVFDYLTAGFAACGCAALLGMAALLALG